MTSIPATQAKTHFGSIIDRVHKKKENVIINKNNAPYVVLISIDEYEDFLEIQDPLFAKAIEVSKSELKKGKGGTLDDLYKIHRDTIKKEANAV